MTEPLQINDKGIILVRGVGDVGSAVAWNLFKAGYQVICHEERNIRTIRRKMAFSDALSTGKTKLEGVEAFLCNEMSEIIDATVAHNRICITALDFEEIILKTKPQIIIDARIQKFSTIHPLKSLSPLTIGIGPGFNAGCDVHFVVESCWGADLGKIIHQGFAHNPIATPPEIQGTKWERFIKSPISGDFITLLSIGDLVEENQLIGYVGKTAIYSPIKGYIRGLLKSGLDVHIYDKLCEIDPRLENPKFEGLAERPEKIALSLLAEIKRYNLCRPVTF